MNKDNLIKEDISNLIKHHLILQHNLNLSINPNFYNEVTIDMLIKAIVIECAEAYDSLPWKWWKDKQSQYKPYNLLIEIVDIYHFLLSILNMLDVNKRNDSIDYMNYIYNKTEVVNYLIDNVNDYKNPKIKTIMNLIEKVMEHALKYETNFMFLLSNFIKLVKHTIDFQRFSYFYEAKNLLNQIRKEKGYDKGIYKKTINGKEDNEILIDLIVNKNYDLEKVKNYFENLFSD